jgi:S1-C subfamily serine protease
MRNPVLLISLALFLAAGPSATAQLPPGAPQMAPMAPQHFVAPNLGIRYIPVPYHNGTFGLRLIAPPAPGSPASHLRLNSGDIIYALDGLAISSPHDVRNHFDQTTVDYVDARTNTTRRGHIMLPPAPQSAPSYEAPMAMGGHLIGQPGSEEATNTPRSAPLAMGGNQIGGPLGPGDGGPATFVAENLGIRYMPISLNNGAFGLRLTAAPAPGSPAAQLQLNPGDMVLAMDGQPITNPNDVLAHVNQTTVDFVSAASNSVLRGVVNLPPSDGTQRAGIRAGTPAGQPNLGGSQLPPAAAAPAMGGGRAQLAGRPGALGAQPIVSGPPAQQPFFAENLSIQYVPVPYNNGTFGLRLIRRPNPNTPLAQLDLEAGDTIFRLDGQPFTQPFDVSQHWDETTVDYFDNSSGAPRNGTVILPPQNPGP